jgi:hypothetical protein
MSATTHARYQATADDRFRRLLSAWLATLTPDGWTGGVADLFAALDAFERAGTFFAFIPTGSALTKSIQRYETTLRAAGFAMRIGRTKSGRFLRLEAIPKPDGRDAHG